MEKFIEDYIRPLALSNHVKPWPERKVRIAVIDSGVKEEDAEIAAAATERIRGYRNFTSSDLNNCEDQIGHGTKVARLLLTVAPEAELYIAKVTEEKFMPKHQLHRIAEVQIPTFCFVSKIPVFCEPLMGCKPKANGLYLCQWNGGIIPAIR